MHITPDFTFQYILCFENVSLYHQHISSANLQAEIKGKYIEKISLLG